MSTLDSLIAVYRKHTEAAAGRVAVRVIHTDENRVIAKTVCCVNGVSWPARREIAAV